MQINKPLYKTDEYLMHESGHNFVFIDILATNRLLNHKYFFGGLGEQDEKVF